MISGASDEELDVAIEKADLLLKIQRLQQENKKLNGILNELESWLEKYKKKLNTSEDFDRYARLTIIEVLDKLNELKGEKDASTN